MTLMTLSVTPLHFLWPRWSVTGATWHFGQCDTIGAGSVIMWCQWQQCISLVQMIKMTCNMIFLVMLPALAPVLASYDANHITNGTIVFLSLRQLIWGTTWLLWSCDALCTGISMTWCWWHYWSHQMNFLGLELASCDADWCHQYRHCIP